MCLTAAPTCSEFHRGFYLKMLGDVCWLADRICRAAEMKVDHILQNLDLLSDPQQSNAFICSSKTQAQTIYGNSRKENDAVKPKASQSACACGATAAPTRCRSVLRCEYSDENLIPDIPTNPDRPSASARHSSLRGVTSHSQYNT